MSLHATAELEGLRPDSITVNPTSVCSTENAVHQPRLDRSKNERMAETIFRALTPELSRADLRRRQSHNLSGTLTTPRSGVGLDELLGHTAISLDDIARAVKLDAVSMIDALQNAI